MGIDGITVGQGLTTPDLAEAHVKRALLRSARRVVVLADHTKVGRADFVRVAQIDAVDTLITDADVDRELVEEIMAAGVEVLSA